MQPILVSYEIGTVKRKLVRRGPNFAMRSPLKYVTLEIMCFFKDAGMLNDMDDNTVWQILFKMFAEPPKRQKLKEFINQICFF